MGENMEVLWRRCSEQVRKLLCWVCVCVYIRIYVRGV